MVRPYIETSKWFMTVQLFRARARRGLVYNRDRDHLDQKRDCIETQDHALALITNYIQSAQWPSR